MQANLIKKCDGIPECDNKFLPVEVMATDMQRLDQWAERVVNYTSKIQYGTQCFVLSRETSSVNMRNIRRTVTFRKPIFW
jgi:hypothetical protein